MEEIVYPEEVRRAAIQRSLARLPRRKQREPVDVPSFDHDNLTPDQMPDVPGKDFAAFVDYKIEKMADAFGVPVRMLRADYDEAIYG